jgi:opacity protein-like surface antigen
VLQFAHSIRLLIAVLSNLTNQTFFSFRDWRQKMRKLALTVIALALTGSAHAADMSARKAAPPPAPARNWAGSYIGFNGGGVWGTTRPGLVVQNMGVGPGGAVGYFNVPNIPGVVAGASNQFNNTGSMFGGHFGYLLQAGNFKMHLIPSLSTNRSAQIGY